jgi:hypothetical protein
MGEPPPLALRPPLDVRRASVRELVDAMNRGELAIDVVVAELQSRPPERMPVRPPSELRAMVQRVRRHLLDLAEDLKVLASMLIDEEGRR